LTEFAEIQLIGSKAIKTKIIAQQYPEKLKILDLIEGSEYYIT
jgi:hypothetical protein